MAKSGQLDVGKLASDLGVSGGGKGLDLGDIAKSLTGGGSQANNVLGALSKQGGGLSSVLKGVGGALKGHTGLAVGGAALAAGAVGAGYLFHKSRGGGSITEKLGSLIPGGGGQGGGISSLLGGADGPSDEEKAQYTHIAEQLQQPSPDQLKEGSLVLARWDQNEWRPGQVGWVDGGQARVTFEGGLERWCDPQDIRLPPTQGQPPAEQAPQPPTEAPAQSTGGLPTIGALVKAQSGPKEWATAKVVDTDTIGERVRVQFENGYECWLESDQIKTI